MSLQQTALDDLEQAILGGVILRNDALAELPMLAVDDFANPRHRAIWAAIRNLEVSSLPIDVVTVEAELAKSGVSDAVGGFAYLGECALRCPIVENVVEYAKQVRDASLTVKIRRALDDVDQHAKRETLSGPELLSSALAALARLDVDQPDETKSIDAIAKARWRVLERLAYDKANGTATLTGFPTGVKRLDEHTGGWQPGIVSIVAARPGHGKSTLGLATADACSAAGVGVHLFSLEDSEDSYAERTMARMSEIPAEKLRSVDFNRGELEQVKRMMVATRGRRWLVDGRSGITADEIVRSVRRHRKSNDTRVAIVDYVQLVKKRDKISSHDALTEIVTTLADAAKADKIAYVVMSQLNRKVEERQDKRPQLSDLRESGSLEERAKCVVALYRGVCYTPDPVVGIDYEKGQVMPTWPEFAAMCHVLVLKNSNGRTGSIMGKWRGDITRID